MRTAARTCCCSRTCPLLPLSRLSVSRTLSTLYLSSTAASLSGLSLPGGASYNMSLASKNRRGTQKYKRRVAPSRTPPLISRTRL